MENIAITNTDKSEDGAETSEGAEKSEGDAAEEKAPVDSAKAAEEAKELEAEAIELAKLANKEASTEREKVSDKICFYVCFL